VFTVHRQQPHSRAGSWRVAASSCSSASLHSQSASPLRRYAAGGSNVASSRSVISGSERKPFLVTTPAKATKGGTGMAVYVHMLRNCSELKKVALCATPCGENL